MKRIVLILAYMFFVAATGNNYAEVITFDSLTATVSSPVPNGYEDFNWSNFDYLTSTPGELSGYPNGTISSPNVGFNGLGDPASFTSVGDTPFTLTSLFLTAAWNDGLNVAITGSLGGLVLDAETLIVSTAAATLETLNWPGINTISISTSGGTPNPNFATGGSGTQVAVDNITINNGTPPIPEPGTLGLVGSGVLALAGAIRRRLKE
jgi:hypothetical protein